MLHHYRITESTMFTIEMTKAVLAQQSLLVGVNLNRSWKHMTIDVNHEDETSRVNDIFFNLRDGILVQSACRVEKVGNEWVQGTCSIRLPRIDPDRWWDFECELKSEDDEFVVTPI
jgi:hypothetical protein